jgi:hypothetical protein
MALAIVRSRGLDGLAAPAVAVEVHLAGGLPSVTLVGLPDTEVKEARDRVRAALHQFRLRVSRPPHHRQPGAGRSAQGIRPLRPADRARHPRRLGQIPPTGWTSTSSPASFRSPASCARFAARWPWCCKRRVPAAFILPEDSAREAALARTFASCRPLAARSVRSPDRADRIDGMPRPTAVTPEKWRLSRSSPRCAARPRPNARWKSPPPGHIPL